MAEKKETKKNTPASESLLPQSKKKKIAPAKSNKSEINPKAKSVGKAAPIKEKAPEKSAKKEPISENSPMLYLLPWVLGFFGVFLAVCILIPKYMGFFGSVATLLTCLLSYGAWAIPVFLFAGAFKVADDLKKGRVMHKFFLGTACVIFLSMLCQLVIGSSEVNSDIGTVFSDLAAFWQDAAHYKNGGFIGAVLGIFLYKFTGAGAMYISLFASVILAIFLFGSTPIDVFVYIRDKIREYIHDKRAARQQETEQEDTPAETDKRSQTTYRCNRKLAYSLTKKNIDVDISDKSTEKQSIFDKLKKDEQEHAERENLTDKKTGTLSPEGSTDTSELVFDANELSGTSDQSNTVGLNDIFAEGAIIEAGGVSMDTAMFNGEIVRPSDGTEIVSESDDEDEEEFGLEVESGKLVVESHPSPEELYTFPPIDLLNADPNPSTFTVTDEYMETAKKLVDTLANFGVKTKITNISCGPTVTRYELQPEVGVRVKSIQNLSDDIALHLAASGVRIEAPIPGKNAVGIEIPNKEVATVYIRDLIESPQFRNLKSKISVGLGKDVAGNAVYMDIAKMPHLLIAGATGMGKSVCINSFIISILYKARPDEVKFIMIDPKKVEFSLYKGIPHLLVPVVNEPKKAAGALAWSVAEMERRFALIEEVGVRNISGYNEITKDDPEKPHMSQIVIIIDELADLMMTAKDEVENSICRLAQKGRAAGMHIVIGTQRPSVDVITGLIKANVPSRIACTVASQVDSRTIIDIAGAEKLIGKGDMLFAPVGCLKPIRVQGSFVSDSEVEAITDFLRENFHTEYDSSIIESIEREAERCGEKKKGKSDFDSDGKNGDSLSDSDEMIMPAIQVALSAGQLSTSLLQRRLSLGYARAARIVDTLEKMGIVSGFEGSKPRRVLITEEQFLEMKMNKSDNE